MDISHIYAHTSPPSPIAPRNSCLHNCTEPITLHSTHFLPKSLPYFAHSSITMAFRSPQNLKSMISRLRGSSTAFTTSTSPKLKAYSPAADSGHFQDPKPRTVKGQFVPVCVAAGMILLATGLGAHTLMHQLKRAPNVHVKKSRRETLPEVEDPDQVVEEGNKFVKKSFFRKVAHVQDYSNDHVLPDPIRGDVLPRKPRAETLQSTGVDPKLRATDN